ncbi:VanZ family protein [Streptomyces sp. NBC_01485]|uniref:VanZ family protein n=1 Tax=Streptomyces sp. NBC_01485 TaxID=2903884 RepID=UPI002E375949|nr:VanZ family protein [Streptomyces sp. NBC_01485]
MSGINFRIESVEVLGPLLAAFTVLFAVRATRHRPGWRGRPALTRLVAALYAAGALHFTLFPIIVDRAQNLAPWTGQVQLIPLMGLLGMDVSFPLNVLLFLPFGMLLPLMTRREIGPGRAALRALAVSASIELTQLGMYILFSNGRGADVDDLVTNTLGAALGCLLVHLALRSATLSALTRTFALPGTAFASPALEARPTPATHQAV